MGLCICSSSEPQDEQNIDNCVLSCVIHEDNVYETDTELRIRWKIHFEGLCYTPTEIGNLYKKFSFSAFKKAINFENIMDVYRSPGDEIQGFIPSRDFDRKWLQNSMLISPTLIVSKTFAHSKSFSSSVKSEEELFFPELILTLWHFCTTEKDNIATFVCSLILDPDTNVVPTSSMTTLLDYLYCREDKLDIKNKLEEQLLLALSQTAQTFTEKEFNLFCKENPSFLQPVYELQALIRRKTLRERVWLLIKERYKKEVEMAFSQIHTSCKMSLFQRNRLLFLNELQSTISEF